MNWLAKVVAYKVMSAIPGGAKLYHLSRIKITRSLAPGRLRVEQKANIGMEYFEELEKAGDSRRLLEGSHLDFGSGWHPTIPLLYYSLGCGRQFLFDAAPVLTGRLLDETIATFLEIVNDPAWPYRNRIKRLPELQPGRPLAERLQAMGMSYAAPYNGKFPEISGSIDVVTSTQVLYYIAREQLKTSMESISGCLKNGGYFFGKIHLDDEYAQADRKISRYNHLRYSPWVWENLINSRLMSYNRLKACDYHTLLENAGLRIERFEVEGPASADLEALRKVNVHPYFAHYSQEELGAKHLTFLAAKP